MGQICDKLRESILQYTLEGKLVKQKINEKVNLNSDLSSNIFDIPDNWSWVKLCDITTKLGDGLHGTPMYSNDGEYYFINGNNLSKGIIDIKDNTKKVSKDEYEKYKKDLTKSTVLYSINGTIGNYAFYNGEKIILGKSACYFNLIEDFVTKDYIKALLNSSYFLDYLSDNATQTTIKNVSLKTMRNIPIPLPPIEEQQRIVDKLDKLMVKIDELEVIEDRLNELKENFPSLMKESILQAAFEGRLTNSNDIVYNDELDQNISSKYKVLKLNDISEIYTGNSISESIKKSKYMNLTDGFNYVGTKDISFSNKIDYNNGVKIPFDEPKFKYSYPNSTLLCIEGGSAGKKIAYVNEKICFGNKLCNLSPNLDKINPMFLYYYLQSPIFLNIFTNNMSGMIGGVSISKIRNSFIPLPPIEEQQRIVDKLDKILPLCDSLS